jgi:hypothetical protein
MERRMTEFSRPLRLLAAGAPFVAALIIGGVAHAAPAAKPNRAAVLQGLLDCRAKTDSADRLACFDAAAARMDQAEAKGDIVVVDREQARTVRKQAFGFILPSLSLFDRGEKPEQIDHYSGVIALARTNGSGRWTIRLEDGAVWNQIDGNPPNRDPKTGMKVEIRAAVMGSYMMSVDGQGAFRAHREQ